MGTPVLFRSGQIQQGGCILTQAKEQQRVGRHARAQPLVLPYHGGDRFGHEGTVLEIVQRKSLVLSPAYRSSRCPGLSGSRPRPR
jgi:hypothetical protein